MDKLSKEKRSWNMSRIKSGNTTPEMIVRKFLFSHGFRYRVKNNVFGKPDIIFGKKKIAIFIHGCFWHQHTCKYIKIPETNRKFWDTKLKKNIERDKKVEKYLKNQRWFVIKIWECQLKNSRERTLLKLKRKLEKLLT